MTDAQKTVRLMTPIAGDYCQFKAGEIVKLSPSLRAKTWRIERAKWRNSLTISNVLALVPDHLVITEPCLPATPTHT